MTKFKLSDLVEKITFKETMFQKAKGLMFRFKFENEALVFAFEQNKKIPIHMLFVFFPIDVIWINSDGEIVDLKKNVLPFTPAVYHRARASTLIELPSGTIKKNRINLMDSIEIR